MCQQLKENMLQGTRNELSKHVCTTEHTPTDSGWQVSEQHTGHMKTTQCVPRTSAPLGGPLVSCLS